VWLVANSYLLLTHYSVSQNMTEDCGKCVVTLYAAWAFFMFQSPCSIFYYMLFCLC